MRDIADISFQRHRHVGPRVSGDENDRGDGVGLDDRALDRAITKVIPKKLGAW
jgi:hypothetical protein